MIDNRYLDKLLNNRMYGGQAVHRGVAYPGEHEAIISWALCDRARSILREAPWRRAGNTRAQTTALLKGLIFGPTGCAMSPNHSRKDGRSSRYFVSQVVMKRGPDACPVGRLPAAQVEAAVIHQIRALLHSPEIIVATWRAARRTAEGLTEAEVRDAILRFDDLWDKLFPAEQARIVHLLVERVDVAVDGLDIRLRTEGLKKLYEDLRSASVTPRAA